MPVDFALLPPVQAVPDKPPSRLVWTVVFFVVTIIGIFAVQIMKNVAGTPLEYKT